MRIVFMGTPDIAAVCLDRILKDGFEVAGVYTQPDRPRGRGMKLTASPVKVLAMTAGIPVFQPDSFREEETVEQLRALKPDICAVVAYGRLLPQKVLDIPKYGCINIHASLLPKYRGSAPYQWAVLNGEKETGVTAMYLVREMDAGDMIDAVRTPIGENETAGALLDRLAVLGAELLSNVLGRFAKEGRLPAQKQEESLVSYASMLDKSMCPIDWNKTARQVHNHVRGLAPWPVATMELEGTLFKVFETRVVPGSGNPGAVLGLTKTGLVMACKEGAVEIRVLQAQGGKRMNAPDYFRGHPLKS